MTDLAKEWQDGTYMNYGLLLKSGGSSKLHFHSNDTTVTTADLRPVLVVNSVVPLPSAALAGLGLLALLGSVRAIRRRGK